MADDEPPTQFLGYAGPQTSPQLPRGLAIAGMVCGIVSVVIICVWFLAPLMAIVGFCLSIWAHRRVLSGTGGGDAMAAAGVICSGITLLLYALILFLVVLQLMLH